MNICGVLVHAHPDHCDDVARAIGAVEGAQLHNILPDGRMIVTVEDIGEISAGDVMLGLHRLPGVLSAALVYHHFEPQPAIEPTARNTGE